MIPYKIIWTRSTLSHLAAIRAFLEQHAGAEIMRSEASRIVAATNRLKQFPASGRPGRIPGTREVVVPPYLMPYRITGETIQILGVFHVRQKHTTFAP